MVPPRLTALATPGEREKHVCTGLVSCATRPNRGQPLRPVAQRVQIALLIRDCSLSAQLPEMTSPKSLYSSSAVTIVAATIDTD
mgnify:CR=1 FL=1